MEKISKTNKAEENRTGLCTYSSVGINVLIMMPPFLLSIGDEIPDAIPGILLVELVILYSWIKRKLFFEDLPLKLNKWFVLVNSSYFVICLLNQILLHLDHSRQFRYINLSMMLVFFIIYFLSIIYVTVILKRNG